MKSSSLNQNIFTQRKFLKEKQVSQEKIKWFNYWEIPHRSWNEFFESTEAQEFIFVPIHWGYHFSSETQNYDFHSNRDFDLGYIEELSIEHQRDILFLIPMGPYSFDSVGGIPKHLHHQAYDLNSVPRVIQNAKGELCKMPSFYSPEMYKEYSLFLRELCNSFKKRKSKKRIKGLVCGSLVGNKFENFFTDSSKTFLKAFDRYVNNSELRDISLEDVEDFRILVSDLFEQACEKQLKNYWDGNIEVVFHGGSSDDLLFRSGFGGFDNYYFQELQTVVKDGFISSTNLLDETQKSHVFRNAFNEMMNFSYLESKVYDDYHLETNLKFKPLILCRIFAPKEFELRVLGLSDFFKANYSNHYHIHSHPYKYLEGSTDQSLVFCFARYLGEGEFLEILKAFSKGEKIALDLSGMTLTQRRNLELFLLENNADKELLNIIGPVSCYHLNGGSLVTFESEHFQGVEGAKKDHFWKKMMDFFNLKSINLKAEYGISSFVLTREVSPFELNYEEVRRVYLYNFSNTKKKAFFKASKDLAFLKFTEATLAEVSSTPAGVEVVLKSEGQVILDFGVIKEKHEKRNDRTL